jgi:hypothetical protein
MIGLGEADSVRSRRERACLRELGNCSGITLKLCSVSLGFRMLYSIEGVL